VLRESGAAADLISAISRLYLGYISAISRQVLRESGGAAADLISSNALLAAAARCGDASVALAICHV